MATKDVQKILRVGIIQNGRIIEERLLRNRETVRVGQQLKNTFVIASTKFPQSHPMFEVKGGKYVLNLSDDMGGRVQVGDGVFDAEQLKKTGKAKKGSNGWAIDLSDRARGKVTLGDVTLLFQFVNPPPLRVLPQLPANMRGGLLLFLASVMGLSSGFVASLSLSAFLQIGTALWLVYMVPPAPRTSGLEAMESRFVRVMLEEPEEPEEVEAPELEESEDGDEVAEEAEETEETTAPDPEPEQEEVAQASNDEPETRTREEIREEAREVVQQQSALAAFYGGGDDATGPTLGFTEAVTNRRAEETLRNQTALGANAGNGIVSSTGIGTSSGAEGEVRRGTVDSGGSSVAAQAETRQVERREAATVTARVRSQAPQSRGTGTLDESNLRDVLRRRQRDIQRCYERALAQNPELRGRITVQFTVGTDGSVSDARLPENGLNDDVGNCILGRVRRWRFEPPSGGTVTVRRPYLLEPGG